MENAIINKNIFKKYGVAIVIVVFVCLKLALGEWSLYDVFEIFTTGLIALALYFSFSYVFVKVLHVDKTEPIPWYASPILWVGVPCVVVILVMLL